MWGSLFLFCSITAFLAFRMLRRLSRPYRWLSLSFGFLAAILAVPAGLIAVYGAVMCSSETTRQGLLAERDLVWSIERQGCGATTAEIFTVRLGRYAWWSHKLLTADAFPIPRAVEAAGEGAVRIVIEPDSAGENAPPEGVIIPISDSGKPLRPLTSDRGVLQ